MIHVPASQHVETRISCRPYERSGFTLVELLVVIGIIGLLVSMLLPSLSSAREQAKSLKCLANLRAQMQAAVSYAQEDASDMLIPLNQRYLSADDNAIAFGGRNYVGSARMAYGGKSGLHDYDGEQRGYFNGTSPTGYDPQTGYGRYSTGNRMGPATRPMNDYLFRTGFNDRSTLDITDMVLDEQLSMAVFRCPSDLGFDSGRDGGGVHGSGIYVGQSEWHGQAIPFFDVMGNSYGTDSHVLQMSSDPTALLGLGVWLRPYSQIPDPGRTTVLKESKGRFASWWNPPPEIQNRGGDAEYYAYGNHGVLREHNVAFADGHTRPVRYEVLDDLTLTGNEYTHTGNPVLRGGRLHPIAPENLPNTGGFSFTLEQVGPFVKRGDDWQDSCFPAPAVHFDW